MHLDNQTEPEWVRCSSACRCYMTSRVNTNWLIYQCNKHQRGHGYLILCSPNTQLSEGRQIKKKKKDLSWSKSKSWHVKYNYCWMVTICVSEVKVDRQTDSWLAEKSRGHTLCLCPDLLLRLFAECDRIADLCILQIVHAILGEVRH